LFPAQFDAFEQTVRQGVDVRYSVATSA